MAFPPLAETWRAALAPMLETGAAHRLDEFVMAAANAGRKIYPPAALRFAALDLTPVAQVKVVILGQDPYHQPGQAHGLAFSVLPGVKVPPSLANIFKEQASDLGLPRPDHGFLADWARQGVLLLNTVLTVEEGKPGSHARRGWEAITDAAITAVADRQEPCVFMLWGKPAQETASRIPALTRGAHHLILTAPHPSPLSAHRGFLGCRHFSRANAFLESHGRGGIDWRLD